MLARCQPPTSRCLPSNTRPLPEDKREEFDEPDYALIDTLFSLAEAHLFMQLVELKDEAGAGLPPGKSYADIYRWGLGWGGGAGREGPDRPLEGLLRGTPLT